LASLLTRRALKRARQSRRLQKGHPKSWKYQRWIRRARARWLRRAKNVLMDSAHYLAKRLVKIAEEYDAYIAFEGLKKVKENDNYDESWRGSFSYGAIGGFRSSRSTRRW
jgi:putative transposase